jgi:uncharacterized membrane protein
LLWEFGGKLKIYSKSHGHHHYYHVLGMTRSSDRHQETALAGGWALAGVAVAVGILLASLAWSMERRFSRNNYQEIPSATIQI